MTRTVCIAKALPQDSESYPLTSRDIPGYKWSRLCTKLSTVMFHQCHLQCQTLVWAISRSITITWWTSSHSITQITHPPVTEALIMVPNIAHIYNNYRCSWTTTVTLCYFSKLTCYMYYTNLFKYVTVGYRVKYWESWNQATIWHLLQFSKLCELRWSNSHLEFFFLCHQ